MLVLHVTGWRRYKICRTTVAYDNCICRLMVETQVRIHLSTKCFIIFYQLTVYTIFFVSVYGLVDRKIQKITDLSRIILTFLIISLTLRMNKLLVTQAIRINTPSLFIILSENGTKHFSDNISQMIAAKKELYLFVFQKLKIHLQLTNNIS